MCADDVSGTSLLRPSLLSYSQLRDMLDQNHRQRPTATTLLQHNFFIAIQKWGTGHIAPKYWTSCRSLLGEGTAAACYTPRVLSR